MTSPAVTRINPIATSAPRFGPRGFFGAMLNRLVQADERYRLSRRLEETPDELLHDMGITRDDLEQMLVTRPG